MFVRIFFHYSMVSNKKDITIRLSLRCENWFNSNPYEGIEKIYECTSKKKNEIKESLKRNSHKSRTKKFFQQNKWIYQRDIKKIQERL